MAKEIKAEEFDYNVFKTIGKDWLLLTAAAGDKINAMTASWGGMGVMWNKNVAFLFLRPQRYTKELLDQTDGLTISVFDEQYRKMMNYFGTACGRNEDKITKSGLTKFESDGRMFYGDARITMFCKKLYAQEMKPECFIDMESKEKWYPEQDYHTMYVVEIERILINE